MYAANNPELYARAIRLAWDTFWGPLVNKGLQHFLGQDIFLPEDWNSQASQEGYWSYTRELDITEAGDCIFAYLGRIAVPGIDSIQKGRRRHSPGLMSFLRAARHAVGIGQHGIYILSQKKTLGIHHGAIHCSFSSWDQVRLSAIWDKESIEIRDHSTLIALIPAAQTAGNGIFDTHIDPTDTAHSAAPYISDDELSRREQELNAILAALPHRLEAGA